MALIFADGFDTYSAWNDPIRAWDAISSGSSYQSVDWTAGRWGQGAVYLRFSYAKLSKNHTSGASTLIAGVHVHEQFMAAHEIFLFGNSGGDQLCVATNSSGYIELRRGAVSATLLATSAVPIAPGRYYTIEAKVYIADVGGTAEVRVNGQTWITYSGDTNGGSGTCTRVDLRGGSDTWYDDFVLLDSTGTSLNDFLGDWRIHTAMPTDGVLGAWTPDNVGGNQYNGTTWSGSANQRLHMGMNAPRSSSGTVTVDKLRVYGSSVASGVQFRGVIYADNGAENPGTLVAQTNVVTNGTASYSGAIDLPFAASVSLTADAFYWFGVQLSAAASLEAYTVVPWGSHITDSFADGPDSPSGTVTDHTLSPSGDLHLEFTFQRPALDNWRRVAELLTDNDLSYVASATTGTRDLYVMDDLIGSPAKVWGVWAWACGRNETSGGNAFKIVANSAEGTAVGSAWTPGTGYGYLRWLMSTHPVTGAPWTVSSFNALNVGIEIG